MKGDNFEFRQELLSLLKKHSYKEGNFTLASGRESKYFIDCKQTLLLGQGHWLAGRLVFDTITHFMRKDNVRVPAVAGVALGGCSLASAVSTVSATYIYNSIFPVMDVLYIRKEPKDHGTKKLIEGNVEKGSNVILLEDTITTGGSSIKALLALKEEGYNPVAVMSVVDRLEGGTKNITDSFGVPVISLYTIEDFK